MGKHLPILYRLFPNRGSKAAIDTPLEMDVAAMRLRDSQCRWKQRRNTGSALHANLREHLTASQYAKLLELAIAEGCTYFTYNIPNTICDDCGYISKHYVKECPHCHSKNVDYLTRVIGFLVRVSTMSKERQEEARKRYYA